MNSDEAERRVRAAVANGDDDTEALCALLDFYEHNVAIIHDQRRERDDLQEQLGLSAADVERLQKVVADQALTIACLRDDSARKTAEVDGYQKQHERDFIALEKLSLVEQTLTSIPIGQAYSSALDDLRTLRQEAQTARLALDVATKEIERARAKGLEWMDRAVIAENKLKWFEEREPLVRAIVGRDENETVIDRLHKFLTWEAENPQPGAAT